MKRVLIVEANEDHTVGGSHQAMFDLVGRLDRTRYEPVVLFYQHNAYVDRLRGIAAVIVWEDVRSAEIHVNLASGRIGKLVQLLRGIRIRFDLLREHRIDLVHINNSPRVGNDDWLPAARLAGIPCIANAMGDAEGESGQLRRLLFRGFDHVMPISAYMSAAMLNAGIPQGRLSRVDLGVDRDRVLERVTRSRAEVRKELQLPEDGVLAVMVGNIRPWKGQHVVLEALRLMDSRALGRLHVAFIGATGPAFVEYEGELRRAVAEGGLQRRVSFVGSRQDVPDFFGAADLALHASVIPEPFGLVVIEALACGAPVIAANTGGPAEIVTPDCGVVYDPAEPAELAGVLDELVLDDERRESLSRAAPERAAVFSIEAYVAGIETVYAHCCERRPGRLRRIPLRTPGSVVHGGRETAISTLRGVVSRVGAP